MQMLEATAKGLLERAGIAVPHGAFLERGQRSDALPAAFCEGTVWVKAQVPMTKRLANGGIRRASGAAEIDCALDEMERAGVGGISPLGFLVEEHVAARSELFLGLVFDPLERRPVLVVSATGGSEVEGGARVGRVAWSPLYPLYGYQVREACSVAGVSPEPLIGVAQRLAELYCAQDATLLELNPLFLTEDGSCVAGDVHLIVDDNAEYRHPEWSAESERLALVDESLDVRLRYGFDYAVIDPEGEVGLLTTGAGATMLIIDELARRGARVLNFADIRTGGLKGDATRLLAVVDRLLVAPRVRAVFINVFGGVTDTAEVAQLLVADVLPKLCARVAVTVRLVGRGGEQAREVLREARLPIHILEDLDEAVRVTVEACRS